MALTPFEIEVKDDTGTTPLRVYLIDSSANELTSTVVGADRALDVNVVGGGGSAGQLVIDGQVAVPATDVGRIQAGFDGANYQFIKVDSSGELQVDVLTLPNIVLASQANPFTSDLDVNINAFAVSLPAGTNNIGDVDVLTLPNVVLASQANPFTSDLPVDVSDRPARDLGKVDIAAFDSSLPTGTNIIGKTYITDGTNDVDVLDDSGTYRLEVSAKIAAGGASQDVHPVDVLGNNLDLVDDAARPTGPSNRVLMIAGHDEEDFVRTPHVTIDTEDGKHRLEIVGKVSTSNPPPPVGSDPVTIDASSPLTVSGSEITNYTISSGMIFTLTQVTIGAEGDPSEKGCRVEVYYVDSGAVTHIIERLYVSGDTIAVYPNTDEARDGTALAGTGTEQIRIIRTEFGSGSREMDTVARGYEE